MTTKLNLETIERIKKAAHEPSDVFRGVLEAANKWPPNIFIDVGTGATGVVGKHHWESANEKHSLDAHVIRDMPPDWILHRGANMLDMLAMFGPRRFSVIQACDIIEHITKEEGEKWLADCAVMATDAIMIFCPIGFWENEAGHRIYPDNPFQEHKSGWTVDDFERLDFQAIAWDQASLIAWRLL